MKHIPLTKGYQALVDDADYEYLNQFNWTVLIYDHTCYAVRTIGNKMGSISMHRDILGLTDKTILTDHKDHNGLNNQRDNLRKCTHVQNSQNKKSSGQSVYLGVHPHTTTKRYITNLGAEKIYQYFSYQSKIVVDGKQRSLGTFKTDIEAAIIYNIASRKYHGEFANPNKF